MSEWIVYSKDGLTERCSVKSLEYNGEWMGKCNVSVTIPSPSPIDFEIGDFLEYRGERFEINYDPSVIKQSSRETYGEGFKYENVIFNSLSDELTRCDFLDYVPSDNQIHYSSLPNFSFFADDVRKLAERIQVNLDRIYKGNKKWTVIVSDEYNGKKDVNIAVNNITCWEALALVKSQFGANFIIKNRTITIGTEGLAVGKLFSYGKGNGLVTIERSAESNQKIITRLRAYGSTRNLPNRYYFNTGLVPNNLAVQNLMLPSFPNQTLDPYIDSENISELGVREGTIFFDGSGDLEEIYPSMEGMTAEQLKEYGVSVSAIGRLDEVVDAEQITDNGIIEPSEDENATIAPFTITLKDIGFDINDYLSTGGSATISMKDGMCGGRDFEIVECVKEGNNYILTCNRSEDTSLGLFFPYSDYQIKSGDRFVLLNIEMPDVYIKAASQRLLNAAKDYLAQNDYVRYSYTPKVDNIFMARQHDEAIQYGGKSLHDTIKEGDFMLFEDSDLGIEGSIIIDALSIKEGDGSIPQYEFTLRNDKVVGTIEKLQNQIDSIAQGGSGSGGGGGYNAEQIKSIIKAIGESLFLSKTKPDRTPYSLGVGGNLTVDKDISVGESIHSKGFVSGFLGGQGWAIRMKEFLNSAGAIEKRSEAELDDLIVRGTLRVFEFIVSQMLGENDNRTFTAMLEVDHYDLTTGMVWLDTQGGKFYNPFRVDDIILVQQFNGMPNEENDYYITKQYELVISEVGVGDLSLGEERLDWVKFRNFSSPMEGATEELITKGDTFVRIDNLSNPDRKGIIQLMTVGADTPYMDIIYGKKTDPDTALKARFGNLKGIYNPLFGWLSDFGAYLTNLYAVGEFRIAHTGDDVSDAIEMTKGAFKTNFKQMMFYVTEEENYLTNGAFAGDLSMWKMGETDLEFLTLEGKPIYANRNLMSVCDTFCGMDEFMSREMFRIYDNKITQLNEYIDKPKTHKEYSNTEPDSDDLEANLEVVETEVVDTLYVSMSFYCRKDGNLWIGFVDDNGNPITSEEEDALTNQSISIKQSIDEQIIEFSGKWDGVGNFTISTTGDIYINLVTITDRPLENYQITTETWIEQDARRIALLGRKTAENGSLITNLGIELNALEERITLFASQEDLDYVLAKYSELEITVNGITSTVTSVKGTADEAKSLANSAQSAASDAYSRADRAYGLADSAYDNAATAIQQSSQAISMVAANFNEDGSLKNTSGLVIASDFTKLSTRVEGVEASISTFITKDDMDNAISNIKLTADNVIINGDTTINDIFNVNKDGVITLGGWVVRKDSLYSPSGEGSIVAGEGSGTKFIRLNYSADPAILYGRNDGGTVLELNSQGSGKAAYLWCNHTSGYALHTQGRVLLESLDTNKSIRIHGGCTFTNSFDIRYSAGSTYKATFSLDYSNRLMIYSNYWPLEDKVSNGYMYVDGSGYVKVKGATRI